MTRIKPGPEPLRCVVQQQQRLAIAPFSCNMTICLHLLNSLFPSVFPTINSVHYIPFTSHPSIDHPNNNTDEQYSYEASLIPSS